MVMDWWVELVNLEVLIAVLLKHCDWSNDWLIIAKIKYCNIHGNWRQGHLAAVHLRQVLTDPVGAQRASQDWLQQTAAEVLHEVVRHYMTNRLRGVCCHAAQHNVNFLPCDEVRQRFALPGDRVFVFAPSPQECDELHLVGWQKSEASRQSS